MVEKFHSSKSLREQISDIVGSRNTDHTENACLGTLLLVKISALDDIVLLALVSLGTFSDLLTALVVLKNFSSVVLRETEFS